MRFIDTHCSRSGTKAARRCGVVRNTLAKATSLQLNSCTPIVKFTEKHRRYSTRRKNFIMVRLQQRPLVGVIPNKQILATAVTFKAVDCPHMTMELDLGTDKNIVREHRANQLVSALQDLETFGLVICELWMKENILIGATWINAINPFDLPDKIIQNQFLRPLNLIIISGWFGIKYNGQAEHLLVLTSGVFRTHAKSEAGDYASSAFYFGRTKGAIIQGLSHNHQMISRSVLYLEQVLILGRSQARALKDARYYRQAHEMVKHAIEYAKKHTTLTHFPRHRAYLYITRAELDELHGSVIKLENAVFWYSEALRYDADNATAKEALNGLRRPSTSVTAEIGKSIWTIA